MIRPVKGWLEGVRDRVFGDPASLIELCSSLALLAWAEFLWSNPTILFRDSYAAFQIAPAGFWVLLFAGVGAAQVAASVIDHRWRDNVRWFAMALASGLWLIVAITFIAGGVSTTAERMYSTIAMVTALATIWLAWKSSLKS